MRRLVGRMIEWFLRYERVVEVFKDPDAQMPNQNYHGDGGYDIYVNESVEIPPKSILNISSGVYLAPRSPIWFEIKGRSSTFHKKGLEIVDAEARCGEPEAVEARVGVPVGGERDPIPGGRPCGLQLTDRIVRELLQLTALEVEEEEIRPPSALPRECDHVAAG